MKSTKNGKRECSVLASEYKFGNPLGGGGGRHSLVVVYLGRSNDLWVAHPFLNKSDIRGTVT